MFTVDILRKSAAWLETALAGSLAPPVRRVMHVELSMSLAYGAFYAMIIPFTQVVLRRLGATVDMLAIYTALLFVGSVFTSFSIVLMRRRRTVNIIIFCWLLGRSLFLLTAFITGAVPLMAIGILFWLSEAFVIPAYTRVIQKIYPESGRGKVMSTVRMGRVSVILLVTPLAGWALDKVGYQVLFPIGAIFGILATYLFTRMEVDEGELPPRQTKTFAELWQIVRTDRNFATYLFCYSLFGLGGMMSWPLYPLVQVDRLQLSYSEIGLLGTDRVALMVPELSAMGPYDRPARRAVRRTRHLRNFNRHTSHLHVGAESVDAAALRDRARAGHGRFRNGTDQRGHPAGRSGAGD